MLSGESDDSDVDENIKDKKFPQVTTSQKSQDLISSLNTNPLLYTAELDMDVLGMIGTCYNSKLL